MSDPWYVRAYGERYFTTYHDEFRPEQTKLEVDWVLDLLDLSPGARILDLCCGFGRHSLELARRGYRVTGLDLSPALLSHARQAADAAGLCVEWIQADMREIPQPVEPYDAVINLFSSFGFLESDQEESKVIAAIARVLTPGGLLLIDTANREIFLRRWASLRWREKPDGTLLLDRLRFDVLTGVLYSQEIVVTPDGQRIEDEHRLRLWAYTEMAALLLQAGFTGLHPYGALDGSPYNWDAYRLVVLACGG